MNILRSLQILKNNNENCLAGKLFVHFMNLILWFSLFYVVYVVIFVPAEPLKKFYGLLCIMGLFADFLFMSTAEPILDNPFKKVPVTTKTEPENAVINTDESLQKALAAGKDKSGKIDVSQFD